MTHPKLHMLIRADAHTAIGAGHLMRCLALAQACREEGHKASFLSFCGSETFSRRIHQEEFRLHRVEGFHPDPMDLVETVALYREVSRESVEKVWVVLDGYHFDTAYQQGIQEAGCRLMVMDDMAHLPSYRADLVVNQNVGGEEMSYPCPKETRLLLGSRYAMLRQEFLALRGRVREIPEVARKILVTLGGSDLQNVTLKVVQALREVHAEGMEARVVIGPSNPHRAEIEEALRNSPPGFQPLFAAEDMPGLMVWADVAISAGGSTCLEMCFMGLPSLTVVLSRNQEKSTEGLERRGCSRNLGPADRLQAATLAEEIGKLMEGKEERRSMSLAGRETIDGFGAKRILEAMAGGNRE